MAALNPPVCDFGQPAIHFDLPDTHGKRHTLSSCCGPKGLLVMFICNHCPYVRAIIDRLIRDCRELQGLGVGCVAIMSNDTEAYPDDAPPAMRRWSEELNFPFPYLFDAEQSVARSYGAVCTPDFFGYNAQLELQYRGRLDESTRFPAATNVPRELFLAMQKIADDGHGPAKQFASIGCSIKWKAS